MERDYSFLDLSDNYMLSGCYIELTSRCNLRCKHCYNDSGELKNEISLDVFKKTIDCLPNNESTSVTLSGGEPLLYPYIWEAIDYLNSKNFGKNLIITNATLVNDEIAHRLADTGISIQVSINGASSTTHDKLCGNGNFERTMQGLQILIDAGCTERLIARCMLSNFNKNEIEDIIRFMLSKDIKHIIVALLSESGRAMSNLDGMGLSIFEREKIIKQLESSEYIAKVKKDGVSLDLPSKVSGGCPLIYDSEKKLPVSPRIDSEGRVFMCQMFSEELYSLGNINDENLDEIFKGELFSRLIWFMRFGTKYIHECKKCVFDQVCGKGCVAMLLQKGSIQNTDGECYLRKKELFERMKKDN